MVTWACCARVALWVGCARACVGWGPGLAFIHFWGVGGRASFPPSRTPPCEAGEADDER